MLHKVVILSRMEKKSVATTLNQKHKLHEKLELQDVKYIE